MVSVTSVVKEPIQFVAQGTVVVTRKHFCWCALRIGITFYSSVVDSNLLSLNL